MMIELSVVGCNRPALVDDCYAHLIGYRWRICKKGYVYRKVRGRRIYLHHVVLPGDRWPAYVRDHINRDKLDNRRSNLRWVTQAQNAQNRDPHVNNRSGYRGVLPIGDRFRATAYLNKKAYRFGMFDTAEEANAVLTAWRAKHMPFSPDAAKGAGV